MWTSEAVAGEIAFLKVDIFQRDVAPAADVAGVHLFFDQI
jgi:hypothetical protein